MTGKRYALKPLGENIWTVDGQKVVFAGAPMHTRMTIVRLSDQSLWIHSPIELHPEIKHIIDELGHTVRALIAPNKLHHMYLREWSTAYPAADVFAERGLKAKIAAMRDYLDITETAPDLYAEDIEQTNIAGNPMFTEAVFFHKSSRTLIFTDLVINLKEQGIPLFARLFLKFEQVLFPNGGIPRLFRWFTTDRSSMRASAKQIRAWQPAQITFCHGEPLGDSAMETIDHLFAWLDK